MAHLKLIGPHAGQTVTLNGTNFVDGVCPLVGRIAQHDGLISYMEKCGYAELVMEKNDDALHNKSDNGQTSEGEMNEKLLRAILSLDPANDEHWIKSGEPAIEAVQAAYGSADVKRGDIKAVAPDFTRDVAVARKAEAEAQA